MQVRAMPRYALLMPTHVWRVLVRLSHAGFARILADAHQYAFDGRLDFHAIADDRPAWDRQVEFYFTEHGQPMTEIVTEGVVELKCREVFVEHFEMVNKKIRPQKCSSNHDWRKPAG